MLCKYRPSSKRTFLHERVNEPLIVVKKISKSETFSIKLNNYELLIATNDNTKTKLKLIVIFKKYLSLLALKGGGGV